MVVKILRGNSYIIIGIISSLINQLSQLDLTWGWLVFEWMFKIKLLGSRIMSNLIHNRPELTFIYLNFFLFDFDNFRRFLACSIPVTGKLLESMSPICTKSDA